MKKLKEDSAWGPMMMFGVTGPGPKADRKPIPSDPKKEKGINIKNFKKMKKLEMFEDFINEKIDTNSINEGVASLASYYKDYEKIITEPAKKIDAILNKEIKSDSTKKALLDLITDLVEEYAFEFADNKRPW
jgi:hypothetical protein